MGASFFVDIGKKCSLLSFYFYFSIHQSSNSLSSFRPRLFFFPLCFRFTFRSLTFTTSPLAVLDYDNYTAAQMQESFHRATRTPKHPPPLQTCPGRLRGLHRSVQEDTAVALREVGGVRRRRPAELLPGIRAAAAHRPQVGVDPSGADMRTFTHPKSCCYVLSPSGTLPDDVHDACHAVVSLPAASGDGVWHGCDPAASISTVLYDRCAKAGRTDERTCTSEQGDSRNVEDNKEAHENEGKCARTEGNV